MSGQASKYNIIKRFAVGGISELYLAKETDAGGILNRNVVIKKILPDFTGNDFFKGMILKEARLLAALNHANIVQVFDAGLDENGEPFMVLEYIEGYDLKNIFNLLKDLKENLRPNLLYYLTEQLLRALIHLHELKDQTGNRFNLVHRDLSPNNVMCSMSGDVKLLDFGLTRNAIDVTVRSNLTGKIPYLSPEQVNSGKIDGRSDLYSLGTVILELMTKTHRYSGATEMEIVEAIKNNTGIMPPVPKSYPVEFVNIILKSMAYKPELRFESSRQMLDELTKLPISIPSLHGGRNELIDFMDYYYGVTKIELTSPAEEIHEDITMILQDNSLRKLPSVNEVQNWDNEVVEQTIILKENMGVRSLSDNNTGLISGGGSVVSVPYNEYRTPTEFYRIRAKKRLSNFFKIFSVAFVGIASVVVALVIVLKSPSDNKQSPRLNRIEIQGPEGSIITVDGKKAGSAPLTVELPLDKKDHEIIIEKKGFFPWKKKIFAEDNVKSPLNPMLRPFKMELEIATYHPGTQIQIIDGKNSAKRNKYMNLPVLLKDIEPGSEFEVKVKYYRKVSRHKIKLPKKAFHKHIIDPTQQ
ncbi:protein kinase [Myxococcota bacterium]|nr:protein kinase [Myxococcota bacterium]MBU1382380.1 protein kinase [Myxococcota bacterium]MBU1498716.1 protein kinase [Myxococcota bacterium]